MVQEETPVLFFLSFFVDLPKESVIMEELDAVALARAVDKGVETAYKAVMKPKEGTILTVAKRCCRQGTGDWLMDDRRSGRHFCKMY